MKNIIAILLVFTLTSCASVRSNIQNFSKLPNDYKGKKIAILGYPKEINDSLEWASYKPAFEKQFVAQGFNVTNEDNADYIAFVTYGIGAPKTSTQVGSTPIYGQTGGGTTYHSGNVSTYGGSYGSYSGTSYSMPTYGVIGSSTYSYKVTEYTRTVAIDLVDKNTKDKVFESKATSTGTCGIIGEVIDEIAEAMFEKFPSGTGRVDTPSKADC